MGIPQTFTPVRRRSFSHHAECWYAESLDGMGMHDGEVDHVSIEMGAHAEGGLDYEFRVAWRDLGRGPASAQLQVFDESWIAFAECADLFAWLARCEDDIQPQAFIAGLLALGFDDLTPRVRGE